MSTPDPVLPAGADEDDLGWGEHATGGDSNDARLREDRPPHHEHRSRD